VSPALVLTGCPPVQSQSSTPQPPPASLVAADQALSSNMPDVAITDAQSYIRGNPHGAHLAEAYYFEGRGFESKVAADPAQVQQDFNSAGNCYTLALQQNPAPALEGDIRASLSNVYFFQDRFSDAIYQLTQAMPLVSSPQVKSLLLLRKGECEQRLSRFSDADETFHRVEQRYPNSPVAEAARDHEGQTKFYVQLATYNNDIQADQAINSLQSSGEVISKRTTPQGLTIIDAGSYPSYTDAKHVKDKLIKNFPMATIVP
jgi:tetratricopeptide (TPR) repeat protein